MKMANKIAIALMLAGIPFAAFASNCTGYNTSNCMKQGGSEWVVGGTAAVASGGSLDVESGGSLKIAGTAINATAAEINAATDLSANSEDVTTTNALAASECGKTMVLNSATEFVTTLPAPTAGCKFTFIVKAAPSGASYTVVTASSANIIIGHVVTADIDGAADGDSSTADDTITFADGVAVVGDRVDVYSDGTSWYYVGHSKVYNGITASQAS